jgi:peptidoglycan/LPS O-acetylase OafA/YrhL
MHHLLLTLPWFADRVGFGKLGVKGHFSFSLHNIFEYTPFHLFYGGTEAVIIFFVLSGYVLVNPINKISIHSYVRNRLVRLYGPIFIAVTIAAVLVLIFSRTKMVGASWWMNSHAIKFSFSSYFKNLWVVEGNDWLDSSLWTMRYEIIFSLAIVTFAGVKFRKSYAWFICALVIISGFMWAGMHFSLDLLGWLPVFFAGTALHWLPGKKIRFAGINVLIGVAVLFAPWYFAGFGYTLNPIADRIFMTIGAVIIIAVCRDSENWVAKLLSSKTPVAAGRYSYSLYLIHAPILTTVWFVMGQPIGHIAWLIRFGVAIVCILLGTALVYQFGEKPALRWVHSQKG